VVDPIPVSHCVGSLHPRILVGFTDDIQKGFLRYVKFVRVVWSLKVMCAVNYQRWVKANTAISNLYCRPGGETIVHGEEAELQSLGGCSGDRSR